MLAATSRRLTKAAATQKRATTGLKTRNYASIPAQVRGLKPATYSQDEVTKMQAWLDKMNADPAKQNALNAVVEASKKKMVAKKSFWKIFAPVYGVKVPEKGLKREVLAGVIWSTTQSWSEYLYALRMYQTKLQQDETFYKLHADLRSKDKKVVKKAKDAVLAYLKSIQTKASTAQFGVLHLLRHGLWDAIRSGEAARIAEEYIVRFKREVKIEITTAQKLTPTELEHYKSRFHQIANDERTKIFITTKEDPSILGGEILNINGHVYDQSWKAQQEQAIQKIGQYNNSL